jgi:hypothetical protein
MKSVLKFLVASSLAIAALPAAAALNVFACEPDEARWRRSWGDKVSVYLATTAAGSHRIEARPAFARVSAPPIY